MSTYVFGPYRLDPGKRLLLDSAGQPVTLRGKVFDLLWHLIQHRGRLVEKTELLATLWPDTVVEENNLNQAASALRQALDDDPKSPRYIATVKGRGYQFVGDVSVESGTADIDSSDVRPAPTRPAWHLPAVFVLVIAATAALIWLNRDADRPAPGLQVIEHFPDARLELVTDFPGSHSEPTLSPDGLMMAYVSDASGSSQIWVKNLQRGDPVQITNLPFPVRSPTWSPGDGQIVFDSVADNFRAIFTVGTLGKPEPRVIIDYGTSPTYAAHAGAFVYTRAREVWIAENDGRDREAVIGIPKSQGFAPRDPALSPDGQWIAFVHADEGPFGNLWLIPASGGEARQLTYPETGGGYASAPAWSPDGRYLVYSVNALTGGSHLWRVDVNSGEAAALTSGFGGAGHAAISAEGTRLAYTTTRKIWRLTRFDPASGDTATIHESRHPIILPVVSADGRTIVFFSQIASGMQLFTINHEGKDLRQLTFDERGENTLPTWAGDGESILYYRGRSLHELNPNDGSDSEVFADFHWSSRNWLDAHGDRITFHNIHRPTRMQKTIVRTLGEATEIELPVSIEAAQWSIDGTELIGWHRQTGELLICRPGAQACQNIESDGAPLQGARPAWSRDGQSIYYLLHLDSGECCALWRIDRDGSNNTRIGELPDYEFDNSYFGVDADGAIIYNHVDRSSEEIWLAVIEE